MKEQLITFETAKLAKEKDFPQEIDNTGWYNRIGRHLGIVNLNDKGEEVYYGWDEYQKDTSIKVSKEEYEECCSHSYSAPTQSLLQKWLRDVHKIHIEPQHSWLLDENKKTRDDVVWWYYIYPNYPHGGRSKTFSCEIGEPSTYEEALEKGLQEALNLLKQ